MKCIRLSTRKLGISLLYLSSAFLGVINLSISGRTIPSIDLLFTIIGTTLWITAACHSTYLKYQDRRNEILQESRAAGDIESQVSSPNKYRRSTHHALNAALHVTASACYLTSDIHPTDKFALPQITRVSGTALWFSSALKCLILASVERSQETDPGPTLASDRLLTTVGTLIANIEYLIAGGLFATSIWKSSSLNLLKVTGNFCWLTANTHDVIQGIRYLPLKENTEINSIELTAIKP